MPLATTKTVALRVEALLANALNSRTLSGGRFSWESSATLLEVDLVLEPSTTVNVPIVPSQFIWLRTDGISLAANVTLNSVTLQIPYLQTLLLTNDFTQAGNSITLSHLGGVGSASELVRILAA
jgi:hypothetical protein